VSKQKKRTERLLSRPRDFTFDELKTVLGSFGYTLQGAGKTGGSRVVFTNEANDYIRLHKPHPGSILKLYQVDDIITVLIARGLL
jgi:hypothetical protein